MAILGVSLFRTGPNLSGTDFTQARMAHCVFANTDLSRLKGLETAVHLTPSSVDVATIYLSKGRIPDDFLPRCGTPESFLKFQRTVRSHRTDFHSCFISYATKDEDFADRLRADLQSSGVRCWFAPHQIQGGKKLYAQIHAAISDHDRLLLILSDHSMNSEWVKTEIANAREREIQEKRQMLFPISLVPFEKIKEWKAFDADTGKDSARDIREYFIADFSNWKDYGSYQQAFQRLLRDLKAEAKS